MSQVSEMTYNQEQDRWIVSLDGQLYGLHCGESFNILIGPQCIECRLELGRDWYIIAENARFNLRIQDRYRVIL